MRAVKTNENGVKRFCQKILSKVDASLFTCSRQPTTLQATTSKNDTVTTIVCIVCIVYTYVNTTRMGRSTRGCSSSMRCLRFSQLLIWISLCLDLVSSFGLSRAVQSLSKRHLAKNDHQHRPNFFRGESALLRAGAISDNDVLNSSSDELLNLGTEAYSRGELDEAKDLWKVAVERDESNASAHHQLGLLYKRQNNLSEASASLQHAIDAQPDQKDNGIKFELGNILAQMGYIEEAEDIFRDILSRDDRSFVKMALANLLLDGKGHRSEALEVYSDACHAGPTAMAFLAGVTADSMGDHSAALEFYKKSYYNYAADEDAALHLMQGYLREGNHTAADALRSRLPSHTLSSLEYALSTPVGMEPSMQFFTYDMIHLALQNTVKNDGLVLEFGVYHGKTIRMIGSYFPDIPVHGFDTFSGIPDDWHFTPKNSYSTHGALPQAPENVQYHVGLFSDTLPGFLKDYPDENIRFMNIDCDLYSSTKDIFDVVHDRVVPGTIIIFDEYVMNPNWKRDEYKAFQEAVVKYGWKYKYLGISLVSQQAVVQIID